MIAFIDKQCMVLCVCFVFCSVYNYIDEQRNRGRQVLAKVLCLTFIHWSSVRSVRVCLPVRPPPWLLPRGGGLSFGGGGRGPDRTAWGAGAWLGRQMYKLETPCTVYQSQEMQLLWHGYKKRASVACETVTLLWSEQLLLQETQPQDLHEVRLAVRRKSGAPTSSSPTITDANIVVLVATVCYR